VKVRGGTLLSPRPDSQLEPGVLLRTPTVCASSFPFCLTLQHLTRAAVTNRYTSMPAGSTATVGLHSQLTALRGVEARISGQFVSDCIAVTRAAVVMTSCLEDIGRIIGRPELYCARGITAVPTFRPHQLVA
jgi:hypothetical protein